MHILLWHLSKQGALAQCFSVFPVNDIIVLSKNKNKKLLQLPCTAYKNKSKNMMIMKPMPFMYMYILRG